MEKVITERDVISKLRKEFRMLERQVENTNLMLGRPTSIRQTASFLISENLSADELAVLYDVPCLLEKIIYYFIRHLEERYHPYALCLREILADGQAEPHI